MFFNRFGKQSSSVRPFSLAAGKTAPAGKFSHDIKKTGGIDGIKRSVAIAMAIQFALPVGMMSRIAHSARAASPPTPTDTDQAKGKTSFEQLFGCKPDALPTLTPSAGAAADSFNAAMEQIRTCDYEKAVTTLQSVPLDALGDADSKTLDDVLTKTRFAAREQRGRPDRVPAGHGSVDAEELQAGCRSFPQGDQQRFCRCPHPAGRSRGACLCRRVDQVRCDTAADQRRCSRPGHSSRRRRLQPVLHHQRRMGQQEQRHR